MEKDKMTKPILCLDFDGVCHSYKSGWQGATVIPDPPVPGLFEFLEEVAPHFEIVVHSARCSEDGGADAILFWFERERRMWRAKGGRVGFTQIVSIRVVDKKPQAFVTIDDRTITFRGEWPSVELLKAFKPWYATRPPEEKSVKSQS